METGAPVGWLNVLFSLFPLYLFFRLPTLYHKPPAAQLCVTVCRERERGAMQPADVTRYCRWEREACEERWKESGRRESEELPPTPFFSEWDCESNLLLPMWKRGPRPPTALYHTPLPLTVPISLEVSLQISNVISYKFNNEKQNQFRSRFCNQLVNSSRTLTVVFFCRLVFLELLSSSPSQVFPRSLNRLSSLCAICTFH